MIYLAKVECNLGLQVDGKWLNDLSRGFISISQIFNIENTCDFILLHHQLSRFLGGSFRIYTDCGCGHLRWSDYRWFLIHQHHANGMSWSTRALFPEVVPSVTADGFVHINSTSLQSGSGFFRKLTICCNGAGVAKVTRFSR